MARRSTVLHCCRTTSDTSTRVQVTTLMGDAPNMSSPVRQTSPQITIDSAARVQHATAGGATILVVDDVAANARLLERLLVTDGHRVLFAHDGEEALERVRHD